MNIQTVDQPGIISPADFRRSLEHPEIARFLTDFERWNEVALPIMDGMSRPYRSLQCDLISLMRYKAGNSVLDFGCGRGSLTAGLIRMGESPGRIVALDPDLTIIRQVPATLAAAGFRGSLKLIRSSSMHPLPVESESLDSIVSGLGGITYSGFFFLNGNVLCGRDALRFCLRECHRVLKSGGYLGFSSLVPNPDFRKIKWQSIRSLISGLHFISFIVGVMNTPKIEQASLFMKTCAEEGKVHYLSVPEWEGVLGECGFDVQEVKSGGYAGQGLALVAQKSF